MDFETFVGVFIKSVKTAYIEVMGEDKWNKLSDSEKRDVVIKTAKDMGIALENGLVVMDDGGLL